MPGACQEDDSGVGLVIEDKERHVVFLGLARRTSGPAGDFLEKFMGEGCGGKIRVRFQKLFATAETEFFGSGIFSFGKAVGVEQITIAGLKWDFDGRVFRLGKHAEEKAIFLDGAGGAVRAIDEKNGWMACAGIAKEFGVEVDENVGGGDEVRFEFAAERLIERGENFRRVGSVRGLTGERNLKHGGN